MNNFYTSILLILLSATPLVAAENDGQSPGVIPAPQTWHARNTRFVFTPKTIIVLGSNSEAEQFAAQQINDELAVTIRCVPLDRSTEGGSACVLCGQPATQTVVFAKAY